jgi:hypothetical protein
MGQNDKIKMQDEIFRARDRERLTDGPFFSFSHLGSCFPHNTAADEETALNYGFLSPREEILYETGILNKTFMKC